jgi:DNA repair exonuclease SbcCD ATPase subunit
MEAKDKYNFIKGQAAAASSKLSEAQLSKTLYEEELESLQTVGWLLTEAAITTQKKLKTAYENTITAALNSVFDREHRFELEFDRRGSRLDCSAVVRTGGMVLDPRTEKGGSVVDIISFVARLAEWVLGGRKSRPIFFMDEPFKNLGTSGRLDAAMMVVRQLATMFGIQLIIITHSEQIASMADRHYVFEHDGEKTTAHLRTGGKDEKFTAAAAAKSVSIGRVR